jgi:signal transduction histidine kinase
LRLMSRILRRLSARIALRLTAVVAAGLACVISVIGLRILVTEEEDLRAAVTNEMLLLTRSVEVAFENALRDRQLADVQETLTALEAIDPRIDLYVVGPKGTIVAQSNGAKPLVQVPSDGEVHFRTRADEELAATHVALQDPLAGIEGLIVARPLDDLQADLGHTRSQVLLTVLTSILASTLLLLFVSRRFVERPLGRMVNAMRQFREDGSLSLEGPFADDEVGTALQEFSKLATELRQARARIEEEQESRAALEGHLQKLDKLATVGQLSAGLAHEVGSPLQVLEGRLKSLERKLSEDENASRVLAIALEQTQRITRVVNQLLSFARPSATTLRETDPVQATRSVLEFLDLEARRRGIKVEAVLDGAPRRVLVDPDHIAQLALNLVRNALEATPSEGRILVSLERLPNSMEGIRMIVEDNGRGMSEGTQAKIFEPFFTTRDTSGGTGLGLAVVRSLAHRYGGQVSVRSEPGRGSTFVVDLPTKTAPTSEEAVRA